MPKIRWGTLLVFAMVLLLGPHSQRPPPAQYSCNFVQNVEQQRVSWKSELPVHLLVHRSVPQDAAPAILRAIKDYKSIMGKEMFVVDDWAADGPATPEKDGKSMIYWLSQWEPERFREQARTTLYWNGNQIYEADIRINAANFRYHFGPAEAGANASVDLESLMIHELGHVLGLTHDSTRGSVMNFSLNDGEIRHQFGAVNLASLHCEY